MEEVREEKISQILSWLQAAARGKMSRKTYRKLQQQKVTITDYGHPERAFFSNLLNFWGWADILVAFIFRKEFEIQPSCVRSP